MLPLRYARRWQAAGIAVLVLVLGATLTPDFGIQELAMMPSDKWQHGVTFAFLTVWFCGQYGPRSYWRVSLGMLAFGAFIELCQRMLTYRSAESLDLLADAIGIGVGLAIAAAGAGGWSLRLEDWLAARR
ncbi:MAG TPA: VanZ family protein [Woeseiaceae bacterium]|nr:VanZ family protein [Woeseiaceae bacterium]